MVIQPFLGLWHHNNFVKTKSRGVVSYFHIWLGRTLLVLGVVNGGLGLKLSKERNSLIIAYSVIAGVVFLLYFAAKLWATMRKSRSTPKHVNSSPQSRSSQEAPRRPYQDGKRNRDPASRYV